MLGCIYLLEQPPPTIQTLEKKYEKYFRKRRNMSFPHDKVLMVPLKFVLCLKNYTHVLSEVVILFSLLISIHKHDNFKATSFV